MQKRPSGLRSTKVKMPAKGIANHNFESNSEEDDDENSEEPAIRPRKKHRDIFVRVIDLQDELREKIHTDQTGKFPVRSSQGNQYLMIMCEMDSDTILFELIRDRTAGGMVKTYQRLVDRLNACGIFLRHQVPNNEISREYEKAIKCNKMTHEKVLPRNHRRNIAEKGIQVAKAHLISVIYGVDPNCPIHIWDRFLPQIEMGLNMLRPSKLVPTISTWAHLHGQHDYNAYPLAPVGCAVEMHVQPEYRSLSSRSSHRNVFGTLPKAKKIRGRD